MGTFRKHVILAAIVGLSGTFAVTTSADDILEQTPAQVAEKDRGCLSCHSGVEEMHASGNVPLACVDCHGGDGTAVVPEGTDSESGVYLDTKRQAHVQPRYPDRWYDGDRSRSANPERTYTKLLDESLEFVRFVNPGDLRAAGFPTRADREPGDPVACVHCHAEDVYAVKKSPMTTSAIFWAAAAYANGILPTKSAILGESYSEDGKAQKITSDPTDEEMARGALRSLLPLPRFETVQPGEYFRAFEKGGIFQPSFFPEIGNPNPFEDPGRPDIRVSNRGRGTGARVSPALINIHKTRLNDPHLSFLGTNDQPGDFRSSGCTACHVPYANDRDPLHSGPWSEFGNMGESQSADPTIPRGEPGHPVRHRFTRAIPTSQCMSCHMHQPNAFLNTYLGYTMWDYVTDGDLLWPEEQQYPTEAEQRAILERNPEGAVVRGKWRDVDFLADSAATLNPKAKHTQFADYHGHGWMFRAVYKRDRKGNLLDEKGDVVPFDATDKFDRAVHLRDIHLENGMHCVDCHFEQDAHSTGLIHGEYADAIEIECQDCHGDRDEYATLRTSGPAAPGSDGTNLELGSTPSGKLRFVWRETDAGPALYQRSMLNPDQEWKVPQVKDSVNQGHPGYNERSSRAKTVRSDGVTWGTMRASEKPYAHESSEMTCYACHSSWITSCSGCHLPQRANVRSDFAHYEGKETRNFATYNPQVIRTDMYMLGINSTVSGNEISPIRSSSALVLSSTNLNRQRIYLQQPPISAPGFSSQAFNPHVPHTVRTVETKQCSDCHVSSNNDNNAWMANLLSLGTNYPNFIGRFAWVGMDKKGFEGVAVTEFDEPQPVIGSYLHSLVFPDFFERHKKNEGELDLSHHHHGHVNSLQLRGEFLFTAGEHGMQVFDVANIDNKDFSERITTAPVSRFGQDTGIKTKHATAVALPTTMPVAPWRRTSLDYPENQEQLMHPIYHFAFISDLEEGLVMTNVDTLTDGDPVNNFLKRTRIYGEKAYNPDGLLTGARALTVAGNHVYVASDRGMVILDFSDIDRDTLEPKPRVVTVVEELSSATAIAVQFRYLFVTDSSGLAIVDVTSHESPKVVARVPIADARNVYVARTYAYVAAGSEGIVIVDIEKVEEAFIDQKYNAGGKLKDTWDVKVASTSSSLFAYVADGKNGLHVIQMTSPETVPGYLGFSPRPSPKWIASKHTHGAAVALSKGLDRDRAVDESGNQVSVFNRIGSRPLNLDEMRKLYMRDGDVFTVSDDAEPSDAGSENR